jgi:hypothetical protein
VPSAAVAPPTARIPPRDDAGELLTIRRGRSFLLAPNPLLPEAERLGLLEPGGLARALAQAEPGAGGRAQGFELALADARRVHVRLVRHGGLAAGVWRGRLLGVARPAAELRTAARLAAAGAPVVRPAFAAGERRRGLWRAVLATWLEPDVLDARAFLAAGPSSGRALRAAAAAGAALRRFHEAGGRHADLHAGNLLLREGPDACTALLVDLDRARHGRPPSPAARMAEIMRLYRSLVKRDLARSLGPRGCAAFLRAYTGADRFLRRALLRHLPRELLRLRWHRLGYRLRPRGGRPRPVEP